MERYEQVPHTADIAAKIYGKTLEDLFSNAAFAMFDMMGCGAGSGEKVEEKVEVGAPDTESLLISFLNEILYISYIKKEFFIGFKFSEISGKKASAVALGQMKGTDRPKHEIKAATYHDVRIAKTAEGYETTVVFDV